MSLIVVGAIAFGSFAVSNQDTSLGFVKLYFCSNLTMLSVFLPCLVLTVLWVELACFLVGGVPAVLGLDWLLSSVLHLLCLAAVVVGSTGQKGQNSKRQKEM